MYLKPAFLTSLCALAAVSATAVAAESPSDNKPVVTIAAGTFGYEEMSLTVRNGTAPATSHQFDPTGGGAVSIGWGVRNDYARCLIEYQYQEASDTDIPVDYAKHHLYFNAQWTPQILSTPVHAIVGGAVGVVEVRAESDRADIGSSYRDREEQYKVTLGLEYRLTPKIAIQGLFEHHMTDNGGFSKGERSMSLDDSNQDAILLGVAMTLD